MIAIQNEPIDVESVRRSVESPSAGGIDLFVGTTRNHSDGKAVLALEYEAHVPMALAVLERICSEASGRWKLEKISIVHRIGKVDIGEASVAIAVSAAHRQEAFDACRWAIDTLKKEAPIWKKEVYTDGSGWIGARGSTPFIARTHDNRQR